MPTPRTPTKILKLRGVDKKHPERMRERENEPQEERPLGDPPKRLTGDERKAWKELVGNAIPGVLGQSDRAAVEMAARLFAMTWDGTATSADYTRLHAILGTFGMTPADRSKISIPKKGDKNPFADE